MITENGIEMELNKCECGSYDEWQPCSPDGIEMEPNILWDGFYRCMNCGNVEEIKEKI